MLRSTNRRTNLPSSHSLHYWGVGGAVSVCIILLLISQTFVRSQSRPTDPLLSNFQSPPPEVRLRMFWRIFGPSWEKPEIDYQLKLMKDAGIGGVMLFPMYPVALDDPKNGVINQK